MPSSIPGFPGQRSGLRDISLAQGLLRARIPESQTSPGALGADSSELRSWPAFLTNVDWALIPAWMRREGEFGEEGRVAGLELCRGRCRTNAEFWMCPGVTLHCRGTFLLLKQLSLGFIRKEVREQIQNRPLCLSSPLAQVRILSAVGSWSTLSCWKDFFSVTELF